MEKVIFLVDMQSFYASIEKAKDPNYANVPLVVSGDPSRRSGVILAACPLAKKQGVKNGERLFEAKQKCPGLVVAPPHMQQYIDVSMTITTILKRYTDLVEPFSIDESFMDVSGSIGIFGSAHELARSVQRAIKAETGVRARVGIGANKILAKLSTDIFAKKNKEGIFELTAENLSRDLWPQPIGELFGVGGRMEKHFYDRAIRTIGQLAKTDVNWIKKKWGIHGQVIWMNANGVDYSPVTLKAHDGRKSIGNGMTLPRDYATRSDIGVVALELAEQVCRRSREAHLVGQTITLSISGADYEARTGFSRQQTLETSTNDTMKVYKEAMKLLDTFWDRKPIRRIGIALTKLTDAHKQQLSLFDYQEVNRSSKLNAVTDSIKQRFGDTALVRAVSLSPASQVNERAAKIGGHYK